MIPLEVRQQRGLPLARNPLGIKESMDFIDTWLHLKYGAVRPPNAPASLFWEPHWPPFLLTWEEVTERAGGVGPDRLITYDQLTDPRFIRTAAYRWFVKGNQNDYSFYSDPTYVYHPMWGYFIMTLRTISTEAWDIASQGLIESTPIFLAGGTIWEAVTLLRRGAKRIVLSNFETAQIDFFRWCAEQLEITDSELAFVDEKEVPRHDDIVIANEYLEHFKRPIQELDRLMINKPLMVYHRSGFNLVGDGHPIPLDFNDFGDSAENPVYSHSEADEIFDLYCSTIPGYEFALVGGGWRDSTRRVSRQEG